MSPELEQPATERFGSRRSQSVALGFEQFEQGQGVDEVLFVVLQGLPSHGHSMIAPATGSIDLRRHAASNAER